MLSVWPHAPESAQTHAAFPGLCRALDAGHLSVRARLTPLSHPRLCHRRTFGGQGLEKKTDHRANTAREYTSTPRIRRVCGSCQCLASCVCARTGARSAAYLGIFAEGPTGRAEQLRANANG